MGSDTSPMGARPLRVSIEVLRGSAPITGRLTDGAGNVAAFTGWLGLMAELHTAIQGSTDGPRPTQSSGSLPEAKPVTPDVGSRHGDRR